MRKVLATLACAAMLASGAARATSSTSPDYSDLWWNAQESGWGAHVTQQADVVFLVLFVYDANRQPRFFVASEMTRAASGEAFDGTLYATQGPAFAGAFNPAAVTTRTVGAAHLTFTSATAGTLQYTVDGTAVSKAITRQSWRIPDLSGDYMGGIFGTATAQSCRLGLPTFRYPGTLHVDVTGDAVTIDTVFAPGFAEQGACRYTGRLESMGRMLAIRQGTYYCDYSDDPVRVNGTFEATAIESFDTGFSGRFDGTEAAGCVHSGTIGGMRRGYSPSDLPPTPDP